MKDLDSEHLCTKCERERADRTTAVNERMEVWNDAAGLLSNRDWPEDGRPVPSDILHLALFLIDEIEGTISR
jgi:hypothetical protein